MDVGGWDVEHLMLLKPNSKNHQCLFSCFTVFLSVAKNTHPVFLRVDNLSRLNFRRELGDKTGEIKLHALSYNNGANFLILKVTTCLFGSNCQFSPFTTVSNLISQCKGNYQLSGNTHIQISLQRYPTTRIPDSLSSCCVTKTVKCRYLGTREWYQRSAGVKTTGKILNIKKN